MRDAENILRVVELQPDYMGFIFYPKSKRFVGNQFEMPESLPTNIKRVGVFVNELTKEILRLSTKHSLDFIQLHGNESVQQCGELKESGLGLIKVFSIDKHFDFKEIKPFEKIADYFLFDTKGENYGGTGRVFDWNILKQYDQQIPFFLSGGLSVSNISQTKDLLKMNLHAVDVNSSVEVVPGIKEISSIKEIKLELIKLHHNL